MLKEHFFMRLILLIVVGAVYVKAYMNMAKRNSKETSQERHIILKIFGVFLAIIAVIMSIMGVLIITKIQFPLEAIGPYISPDMIVRTSDQTMYWGYATFEQSQCISNITGVFEYLALSAYCFMYKSSHSKWYSKVGKIVFCILFYIFFVSATDFHYFDLYEWIAPVLFAIMTFFAFRDKQEKIVQPIIEEEDKNDHLNTVPIQVEEIVKNSSNIEDNSRYMPPLEIERGNLKSSYENPIEAGGTSLQEKRDLDKSSLIEKDSTTSTIESDVIREEQSINEQNSPIQESSDQVVKFCRHCGAKLDYQNGNYCKYCGKQLF